MDQSCQELPVVTHTPAYFLHTPRLSCVHLLNLQLTTPPHVYIGKHLNSLLVLLSIGLHSYPDLLFCSNSLLFCCNVSRKNAPQNTTLPQSHHSFFISFSLSFLLPYCLFYTVGFISLMWAVFTPCLGWEEELIYGSL